MKTAKVKWFNNPKGYGFLRVPGEEEDIFVHYSKIEMPGFKTLQTDQVVEIEYRRGPKGLHATVVYPLQQAALAS